MEQLRAKKGYICTIMHQKMNRILQWSWKCSIMQKSKKMKKTTKVH